MAYSGVINLLKFIIKFSHLFGFFLISIISDIVKNSKSGIILVVTRIEAQVYRFTTYTIMLIYIFSSCRIFLRKSGRSLRSWVQLLWSRLVANKLFFSWISCPETEWSLLTSKPCTFPKKIHLWINVTPRQTHNNSAYPANGSMTDFSCAVLPLNMNWAKYVRTCCQCFWLSVSWIYAKYYAS